MTHQTIASKIQKLIAHAEGTNNEHEAEIFMSKAHAMMEEHSLSLLDLGRLNDEDVVGKNRDAVTFAGTWQRKMAAGLARYFGCNVVQTSHGRTKHLHLIGRESARTTTLLMLPFVLKQVYSLADDLAAEEGITRSKACTAVGNALTYRLQDLAIRKASAPKGGSGINALVPVDLIKAEMEEQFGRLTSVRGRGMKTSSAAQNAAAKVSLHKQASHSAPASRMISA